MQNETQPSMAPHEVLYQHTREWAYGDALIGPMAGFPLQDEIEGIDRPSIQTSTLHDPIFAESPQQTPLPVRLPWTEAELPEKFLARAVQEATDPDIQTRSVCAFLFSKLDLVAPIALMKSLGQE